MRDGVRMAADVYRPKNAAGKVPIVFVRTPYNFNYWDVRNGAPRDMTTQLEAVKRGYAYVEMNERGHFFSEGNYDILGAPRTDGYDAISWIASQPWCNGKVGTIGCSSTAEWQMGVAALRRGRCDQMDVVATVGQWQSRTHRLLVDGRVADGGCGASAAGAERDHPARLRRRRRPRGAVLRTGQLVPWRCGADALHRLALRRAEPGEADVPAGHVTGGAGPRVEVVRPRATVAAGRLVGGAAASAGAGHHQGRGRAAWDLRRLDAWHRHRRRDDQTRAERSGVVSRWSLPRRHADQRSRALVHVLVRRVGGAESRDVQLRAAHRESGGREPTVRGHRADAPLLL